MLQILHFLQRNISHKFTILRGICCKSGCASKYVEFWYDFDAKTAYKMACKISNIKLHVKCQTTCQIKCQMSNYISNVKMQQDHNSRCA